MFPILAALKYLTRTLAVVLIIGATFLVYWPALRNGFVWDDTALVLRDPLVRSWVLIGESFRHFLFLDATASNFYRPIQRLSFIADYQFFGFGAPWGWHFTSVLMHAGAAVALFFLAEKVLALSGAARLNVLARRGVALGVALLWVIHPLHTSAVTYIAGRADPLAALFGFAALSLGLASLEARRRPWLWQLGAAAGFALALLSKESGATFLLIWLLVLLWRRARPPAFASWAAIFAIVIGGYCGLRFTANNTPPPPPRPTPLAIRPILATRAIAEYSGLIVAPVTLRMERDVSTTPRDTFEGTMQNARLREFETLAGVVLLIAFAAWARYAWRRERIAGLCLAAFAVAYIPISNALPLNATIAEHWLYVPSAFLFLAAALTLLSLGESERWASLRASAPLRLGLTGVFLAWVVLLGARTFLRQADWRDQRTFIERTISAGGDSARMLMNLANVESNAGQNDRAIALYREALRRSPEQPIIWLGYASILIRAGEVSAVGEALSHAESSPFLRPECLQLRGTLALALHVDYSQLDPRAFLREAVAAAPANWPIRKRYVETLAAAGDFAGAQRELGAFLERQSFRAEAWKLLAQLLERSNEPERAKIAYAEAARRDVRDEESSARAR
jgi:cytochrome c-type biogenesis protein CcmH/NrfG